MFVLCEVPLSESLQNVVVAALTALILPLRMLRSDTRIIPRVIIQPHVSQLSRPLISVLTVSKPLVALLRLKLLHDLRPELFLIINLSTKNVSTAEFLINLLYKSIYYIE